jgi:AraC-like DNA-binding protein
MTIAGVANESPTYEWVTAAPSPHVAPFVERYIGYRIDGFKPCVHHGLPSRFMTFIVSIGDSIEVLEHSDSRQRPGRYRGVLAGLTTAPTLLASPGHEEGIAIELTPLGFRRLLAMPARELWNSTYECAEVVGDAGDVLWERLQVAGTWPARFAACDDVLGRLRRTVAADAVGPELSAAWDQIVRTGGTVRTAELAANTGWSRQHLTRRFRAEFGTGPKSLARVVRFERAVERMRNAPAGTIADVAAECGYFDQAHLDHDFAALAGCSPTTLLYEDVPSFQADAVVDSASSSS